MGILNQVFRKNGKKGQLEIQETILVVFIFVVLIIFGMVFFFRVQSASIADDFNKFQRERLAVDFVTLGDIAEFSCSRAGIIGNCVDTLKLIVFKDLAKGGSRDYYFGRFGYRNISIYQIYPEKNNIECSLQRGMGCGVWNVYSEIPDNWRAKEVRDIPVSLYFPCNEAGCNEDYYTIGIMTVEDYYA